MGCLTTVQNRIPARYVLCFMLFLGFMVTFLLRVNINLAVVAMVNRTAETNAVSQERGFSSSCKPADQQPVNLSDITVLPPGQGEFEWNELQQSVILGSFFWGYLLFQVPGGRVAEVYGTKRVFGGAILFNGVLAILLPGAARAHWSLLLVIRALQGLAQGVQFPALSATVARWVPLAERARFLSFACCGVSLGTVVSLPLCGTILQTWGWEAVFYVSGLLALIWSACWWLLVYETPHIHPRISLQERQYLAKCLDKQDRQCLPVPWRAILTSWQFWLGCIAAWGNDWGFHTFITLGPKYIKEALGFDLEKSSWLTSLPFLCQYVFATGYGVLSDELIKCGLPLIYLRRISTVISHLLPALGMVALAFIGCNITWSVVVLTAAVSLVGAFSSGFFQNPLDIAPNFAGSLMGIMNGVGSLTGAISTPIAGAILYNMGPTGGWPVIFCIAACMYTVCSLPYLIGGTAKIQPWNDPRSGKEKQIAMKEATEVSEPLESDILTNKLRIET